MSDFFSFMLGVGVGFSVYLAIAFDSKEGV